MRYTIKNITYKHFDLDEEIISFEFEVHVYEPEIYVFKQFVFMHEIVSYTEKKHPEFYSFWIKARKSIGNWGSNDFSTLQAVGEAALEQIYAFVIEYTESRNILELEYIRYKEFESRSLTQQEEQVTTAKNLLKDLNESGSDINNYNKRFRKFCITVEKSARDVAYEIFPEIANLESERLLQFEYIFDREINKMYDNLENFMDGEE